MKSRTPRFAYAIALALSWPAALAAQSINFVTDLPRTMVLIRENDEASPARREIQSFLRAARFPVVDGILVRQAPARQVEDAINGDAAAALQLGRDFGAHVLVLGTAVWDNTLDNSNRSTRSRTAEIELRVLRLDNGAVIARAHGRGSAVDADAGVAGARAVRHAIDQVVQHSDFMGAVVNNWEEVPWSARGYFEPDPGSIRAAARSSSTAPALAVVKAELQPPPGVDARGLGLVRNPTRGIADDVRIEGFVLGRVASVLVAGQKAELSQLQVAEARRLGLETPAQRFRATLSLSREQDAVTIHATAPGGEVATAQATPRVGRKWAVIVGVSNYRNAAIQSPRFAARDAQAVHDFLSSTAAGPFEPDNVLLLTDELATTRAVREALFMFLQRAAPEDLVLFYFAGQGAPDPMRPENVYLLTHDADPAALATSALPMWDVKTALRRRIRAERIIVIADASRQTAQPNPIHRAFTDLFTPSSRLVLTGSGENEPSHEDARRGGGHGVFTYNLIEGLKGLADTDRNGIVTFNEVAEYVSGKVKLETSGRQSPMRAGLGDLPLAEVPQRR